MTQAMRRIAGVLRNTRAASAVEFALLAPVFIGFVLLIVEGGRMMWTQQVLNEVATSAARCMGVGSATCSTSAAVTSFARARGSSWGVGLATATVTVADNQTCNAVTGMNKVSIALPYSSSVGAILPNTTTALRAAACYPS